MKVGIIGGGNPYALNLAQYLHSQKIDHFGIGRSPQRPPAMWVSHHYRYHKAHLITELEVALAILDTERPDYIVNFAAQGEGQGSFGKDAHLFYATNCTGLVRLVDELRTRPYLKKFVQIGTSELYGSVEKPSLETDPIKPTSPYAISKAAFDLHLEVMGRVHGFNYTVIRPSNCYCPMQQLHRIIPRAIICALSGNRLPLQGGGRARKSYLHATDLSRAILLLLTSEPGIYNCGPEIPTSIKDVVYACATVCDVAFDALVEITDDRVGQDGQYWLDSSKIHNLGWSPENTLWKGIEEMVQWIKSYPELLSMPTDWKVRP